MLLENIKIQLVGELHQGTSSTTGKSWARRNILLAFEDEDGEEYINAVVDEELWKTLNLREGDLASITLRFRTRKFQSGFVSNDIRIIQP
ncbi:MAG: hypothetical protein IKU02_08645 [Bacteroidaceae bacterium]|nr:hypothetical protein [Bacteroidaceae bacterium]